MAKCIICNRKLVKADNKVCPDCGEIFYSINQVVTLASEFKKKAQTSMFFSKNKVFFRSFSTFANMFGALGALIGQSHSKSGCYNAADITSIEYPVAVPKLYKSSIVISFSDGRKITLGSMGSKKKSEAAYEVLKKAYNK